MNRVLGVIKPAPHTVGMTDAGLPAPTASTAWSDRIGILASIGCAVHCAAMPFVLAYLPSLGLSFLADESFHKWMAIGCFAVAMTAFIPGFRKHRRITPLVTGGVGLVMICFAAFFLAGECCAACDSSADSQPAVAAALCTEDCCANADGEILADRADSAETRFQETPQRPALASKTLEEGGHGEIGATSDFQAIPNGSTEDTTPAKQLASIVSPTLIESLAPWLTPLGGIVLVFAHLLNRRYGCLCGCCSDAPVTARRDNVDAKLVD